MRGCRKRASNDTPEEPVSHRRRKAGSRVSYVIKWLRNVKRGLTTPKGIIKLGKDRARARGNGPEVHQRCNLNR